jgi:hypothetical protein
LITPIQPVGRGGKGQAGPGLGKAGAELLAGKFVTKLAFKMANPGNLTDIDLQEIPLQDCTCYTNTSYSITVAQFSPAHSSPPPRGGHTANYSPSQQEILIYGGSNRMAEFFDDLHSYNASSNAWKALNVSNKQNKPSCRACHAAIITANIHDSNTNHSNLNNNINNDISTENTSKYYYYVHGGQFISLNKETGAMDIKFYNDFWRLDLSSPSPLAFTPLNSSNSPARNGHTLLQLSPSQLILFGGSSASGPSSAVFLYNFAQNDWTEQRCEGEVPAGREMHAAALQEQKMIISGGRSETGLCTDFYCLDTKEWRWSLLGKFPPRCSHSMHILNNSQSSGSGGDDLELLIFGGTDGISFYNDVILYSRALIQREQKESQPLDELCRKCNGPHGFINLAGGNSGETVHGEGEKGSKAPAKSKEAEVQLPMHRFAHSLTQLPNTNSSNTVASFVLFGGVNAEEDLNDTAIITITRK